MIEIETSHVDYGQTQQKTNIVINIDGEYWEMGEK